MTEPLTTFPQFPLLPTELQLKVLRHAFFSTAGFTAWLAFADVALQYLSFNHPIPAFWKSPRYQLRPGLAIFLGQGRRIMVYEEKSIPNLIASCRLGRQVALEEWRRVLGDLLVPLSVPCESELRLVEIGLEDMRKGKVGRYLKWTKNHDQNRDVVPQGTNITRF